MRPDGGWGWRPSRAEGVWRHGCAWARPAVAAAPWATLALLLALFALIGDRLPDISGVVFELPPHVAGQAAATGLAAFALPGGRADGGARETLVFFDDARYSLADDASRALLRDRLGARAAGEASGTLLLLADARVPAGDVMRLVGLARAAGVARVQVAERRAE